MQSKISVLMSCIKFIHSCVRIYRLRSFQLSWLARPYRSIDRRTSCFSDNVFISLRLEKLRSHVTGSTKAMHKDNTARQTLICTPTVMRLAHEKPAQQAIILAVRGKKGASNEMSHLLLLRRVGDWWCCEISSVYSDGRSVRRGVHGCHLTSTIRSETRRSRHYNVIRR